ncbi:hypothetical protein EJ02DRAFT_347992 [Clathrospora elynae]|uniref:BTB domain-containing protein n=1 Tax=Clathrospora elynae TaxID=706981 RepID=A0A6A5SNI6_9PLEO|nr:hypothetical protein EJ02DRAFT_347992 [Clathrospora elynae]
MFVTPVFVARNVLDPSIYASKRDSQARTELSLRLSTTSSNSSVGLYRTSSTSSNTSVETAASSAPSVDANPRSKHRKSFSSGFIPQRFLNKPKLQEPERQRKPAQTSSPVISAPVAPPSPVVPSTPKPATEWQCSDLVVRCKNDVYHVDRVIMCHHSRWFAKVCAVVLSVCKTSKNVIDLSADDPDAVAAMMQYCYQLDYTDRLNTASKDVTLRYHVDVYMLAERYGVSGLKRLSLQKFEDFTAMVLIVDGNEEQLLHAIRAMYASDRNANADDLRRLAVSLCADHVQAFIHGTGRTMALVFESMEELPEFRADLFEEMASRRR